jgi:hypothetical protein
MKAEGRLTTVDLYAVEGLQLVDKVRLALNACASYLLEEPFRAVRLGLEPGGEDHDSISGRQS